MKLGRKACQKTPLGMARGFRRGGSRAIPKWHLSMAFALKKGLVATSKKKKTAT